MKDQSPPLMALALAGLVMVPTAAPAQEAQGTEIVEASFAADDGGAARIEITGKLRMLSQMIPASACQVASGYNPDYAASMMTTATAEFQRIIEALELGNIDMGIPTAEERRITLAAIQDVRKAWEPMQALVNETVAGRTDRLTNVRQDSVALLDAAQKLVVEVVAQYSNPVQMAQAEAFLIDIAGRQRMLIQMISKSACLTLRDKSDTESRKTLIKTMTTFETTLGALQFGMESVGIRKPPTSQIDEGLGKVATGWKEIKPFFDAVAQDVEIDQTMISGKLMALDELMATMNDVVVLYTKAGAS